MAATIYSPPSLCPSINEDGVRDARGCAALLVLFDRCVCTCRPWIWLLPSPLDLLTMSASTKSTAKNMGAQHPQPRKVLSFLHFNSVSYQCPWASTSWDPVNSPVIYLVHLLPLWFVTSVLYPIHLLLQSHKSHSLFSHSLWRNPNITSLWLLQFFFSVPSLRPPCSSGDVAFPVLFLMMPRTPLTFLAAVSQQISEFRRQSAMAPIYISCVLTVWPELQHQFRFPYHIFSYYSFQ